MTERYRLYHGDCLDILPTLPSNSVDLIVTDPPYFKVKNLEWDRQWAKPADFLGWLDIVLGEFHRLLKPNGSLYLFASPQMGRKVANTIEARFNVLNEIRWVKEGENVERRHEAQVIDNGSARSWLPAWESIVFAEHYGAEGYAKGEAGYDEISRQICREVFQIGDLCERYEVTRRDIALLILEDYKNPESAQAQASNWILGKNIPNAVDFLRLKTILPIVGEYEDLRREYEDLRREYEDLRREYEDLRRPFSVSPDVPYTDVWTFPTVQAYPGKHECEKPAAMIRHIVEASSRPGAVVLDAFAGSGVVGEICGQTGRDVILIEKDRKWYRRSKQRTAAAYGNWDHAMQIHAPKMRVSKEKQTGQLALFG